jgi:hypothetical protein
MPSRLPALRHGGEASKGIRLAYDLAGLDEALERQDLLDGIALGQTMPGPLAAQVAMWVGYLRRSALGALGTAAAFILGPSAAGGSASPPSPQPLPRGEGPLIGLECE